MKILLPLVMASASLCPPYASLAQVINAPLISESVDALDPSGSASATNLAATATPQSELETYPRFGALQDFSGLGGTLTNGSPGYVFAFSNPSLPAVQLVYSGADTAADVALSDPALATSGSGALHIKPAPSATFSLTIKFGTYTGGTFSAAASRSGVEAAGFTLTGGLKDFSSGMTITYKNAANATLSTQTISSSSPSSWYSGYAVTNGQDPIASIVISFTTTSATPESIGLDDLGFSYLGTELLALNSGSADHLGNFQNNGSSGRAFGWGEAITSNNVTYSRVASTQSSGNCQQIVVGSSSTTGAALQRKSFDYQTGYYYIASVWLRADSDDPSRIAIVSMRDNDVNPNSSVPNAKLPHAIKRVQLSTTWQKVYLSGWGQGNPRSATDASCAGQFRIDVKNAGTYQVDGASVLEVAPWQMEVPSLLSDPIPQSFFGLHMHNPSAYGWPSGSPQNIPFGVYRLWDTGVAWGNLKPTSSGSWQWTALDNRVNLARTNNAELIMTLGMTPTWASSAPTDTSGPYFNGSNFPPADLDDWSEYINQLYNRYGTAADHKIKYWEIWNEPDYDRFWKGNMTQLVELAEIAYDILKQNPNNIVISPGFTKNTGLPALDDYMLKGGDQFCDYVGYHFYPRPGVEVVSNHMRNVQELMRTNPDLCTKQLWDTEAGWSDSQSGSDATDRANHVARMQLVRWPNGVANACYYAYDSEDYGLTVLDPLLSKPAQNSNLSPSGIAYREVADWMIGATVINVSTRPDGIWVVKMARPGGYVAYAVWHPTTSSTVSYTMPGEVTRKRTILSSGYTAVTGGGSIAINQSPILLENQAP